MPESVKTRSSSGPTTGAIVRASGSARVFSALSATPGRIFAATVLAVLACAPAASGAQLLAGGETRVQLNRGLVGDLRAEGVAIRAVSLAKLKGRRLTLPVSGGTQDEGDGTATLVHGGELWLTSGRKTVVVRRFILDGATRSLTAKVSNRRVRLAALAGAEVERDGFDARVRAKRLLLTRAGAAALNRGLGLPTVLRAGRSLGSVNGLGKATTVEIASGSFGIGGSGTAFAKLESLEVQLGIWGASERWATPGDTHFFFQIEPTVVTADASDGILESDPDDGISMEIHSPPPRNMLLRGPRIDLATGELSATVSSLSTADAVTAPIATLDYAGATFQIRPRVGVFELMGIRAVANQFIADQLNARFQTPGTFQAGETLARVTVILRD